MLRTTSKKKINSIMDAQLRLHRQGILEQDTVSAEVLEDCQQAALAIGQRLEKELPDCTELIRKLDQYCEEL